MLGVIIIKKSAGIKTLPSNNKPNGNRSEIKKNNTKLGNNKNVDSILINAHGKCIKKSDASKDGVQ